MTAGELGYEFEIYIMSNAALLAKKQAAFDNLRRRYTLEGNQVASACPKKCETAW
jgi:hypothetical protein